MSNDFVIVTESWLQFENHTHVCPDWYKRIQYNLEYIAKNVVHGISTVNICFYIANYIDTCISLSIRIFYNQLISFNVIVLVGDHCREASMNEYLMDHHLKSLFVLRNDTHIARRIHRWGYAVMKQQLLMEV